ncbi:MAG: hypothetical protein LBQ31_00075, partial [Bacteroidales bacterium]|nr:hypothetical protein [Bacteroidales bacterium]
ALVQRLMRGLVCGVGVCGRGGGAEVGGGGLCGGRSWRGAGAQRLVRGLERRGRRVGVGCWGVWAGRAGAGVCGRVGRGLARSGGVCGRV